MAKSSSILNQLQRFILSDSLSSILAITLFILISVAVVISIITSHDPSHHLIHGNEEAFASSIPSHLWDEAYDPDGIWQSIDTVALTARTVYVIPGGGSGVSKDSQSADEAYPLWTKQRVDAAYNHYSQNGQKSNAIFIALSAGSLNAPNIRSSSGNIVFECQHIMNHLKQLGVKDNAIFGDFISWDTVGNGLTLRLYLEALLSVQSSYRKANDIDHEPNQRQQQISENRLASSPISIEVFISDFHADRVQAIFEWVLNLSPSLISGENHPFQLKVHSVSSKGVQWKSDQEFTARIEHERKATEQVHENAKHVKTFNEFKAFALLGPHKGIANYLHGKYIASKGGGW